MTARSHVIHRTDSPAMAAALAEIERAFGSIGQAEALKRRCRMALRAPPGHRGVRARYQARALLFMDRLFPWLRTNDFVGALGMPPGPTPALRVAINLVAEWRAAERGDELSRMVLAELALICRWFRRYRTAAEFGRIVAEIAAS